MRQDICGCSGAKYIRLPISSRHIKLLHIGQTFAETLHLHYDQKLRKIIVETHCVLNLNSIPSYRCIGKYILHSCWVEPESNLLI